MLGLIYKDLMALRSQLSTYVVFFLIYGGLCAAGVVDTSILSGLVVLVSLITPMSTVTADDISRWNRFAVATPAGRRGVVAGKYLFALLMTALSALLVGAILAVLALLGRAGAPLPELLLSNLACAGIALVLDAVVLPLLLKFGSEKARIISMALFAAVFGGCMLAGMLANQAVSLPRPPSWLLAALPALLAVLAVGGFVLSYFIAQAVYAKKEF